MTTGSTSAESGSVGKCPVCGWVGDGPALRKHRDSHSVDPIYRTPAAKKNPKRLRQRSARRTVEETEYRAAAAAVLRRSGGRCEATIHAEGCTGRHEETHHITPRSVATTAIKHDPNNLIGLSVACHHKVTNDPAWGFETGLLRRSWDNAS